MNQNLKVDVKKLQETYLASESSLNAAVKRRTQLEIDMEMLRQELDERNQRSLNTTAELSNVS